MIFVAVVVGQTTQKVATLGQRVRLPCHIDGNHAPSDVQVGRLPVSILE